MILDYPSEWSKVGFERKCQNLHKFIDSLESMFAYPALFGCVTLEKLLKLFVPHVLHEVVVMINELIHMKPLEQILVHSEHVYVFAHIIIWLMCMEN